ncbi:hypothetical protein FRC03_012503 [Tulasnella sp. 419]|nr:hypothetical protein FRC03_012503 [Tulasnella sp. 419]
MSSTSRNSPLPDDAGSRFDADWVNEAHIQAFEKALEGDEDDQSEAASPVNTLKPLHERERTRKISAVSDFAPINTRVKRRKRNAKLSGKQGFLYHIVRWPLLGFIFMIIFAEFGFYVFIRHSTFAFVRMLVLTVPSGRGRRGTLRAKLRQSKTYEEWKDTAKMLDEYLEFDKWKKDDADIFYDYPLVKKVRQSLRRLRAADDAHGVLGVLEVCIRANFAGTESPRLYSESFIGTKDLIESYVSEVEAALVYIRRTDKLSIEEKRKFFRSANTNLGSSALCLSGGASFGYYHFGVVRAFLDAGLLPRVIAGTSAGGLIAALICTRTDAELRQLLVPELADKITACEEPIRVWMKRFLKTGARFDTAQWARKSAFFTRGSLTFREAYELTGRVLNISVIPYSTHSPTKLLNHLTSPDCVIWSAIIASAAVPGILNPVVLMQKTKNGNIVPWNWGSRFKDGSLRVDIPLQSLNLIFNVNYPIVSQVNPHVHIFYFGARGSAGKPVAHRKGKGWRGGFILSAAEQFLKHELTKNFKVIRDLELLPQLLGQDWSSVFLQRFDGAVTIWPRSRIRDWFRLLTDPDPKELERMMQVGKIVTFPKLHMIENRYRMEREIYRGRLAVRQALQAKERDRPTSDQVNNNLDLGNAGTGYEPSEPGPSNPKPNNASRSRPSSSLDRDNGRLYPWPNPTSAQLPIESEAEKAFSNRDAKTRRGITNRRYQLGDDTAGSSDDNGAPTPAANGNGKENPLRSQNMRRRWANSLLREEAPEEEEETRQGKHSLRIRTTGALTPQPESPTDPAAGMQRSSSFMARLRPMSFPLSLSRLGSFGRNSFIGGGSNTAGGSGTHRPLSNVYNERWSSDSDDEDDSVPWSGALMSPSGTSGSLRGSTYAGLGLNVISPDAMEEDERDEDAQLNEVRGRDEHRGRETGMEVGGVDETVVPPKQSVEDDGKI